MPDRRPKVQPPAGACDCHMHFYGPEDRYPLAPTAAFLPPPVTVDDYRQVQARLGLERVVVVQPTAYGTDNRCTMDAVTEIGEAARAVVVVDQTATDAELERLTRDGARGIRFHMFRGGVCPGRSSRRWRRGCMPSAGTSSCSATAASCPSAKRC